MSAFTFIACLVLVIVLAGVGAKRAMRSDPLPGPVDDLDDDAPIDPDLDMSQIDRLRRYGVEDNIPDLEASGIDLEGLGYRGGGGERE